MYQLQDPNSVSYRSHQPFIDKQLQEEGPTRQRECTDIICLVLFLLFIGAFIGILIYALVAGNPTDAISIHNASGIACYQNPNFSFGYFPVPGSVQNAMCVNTCPKNGQTVNCLNDTATCTNGSYTAPNNYSSFAILSYCVPNPNFGSSSVFSYFDYNIIVQWVFDIEDGYLILIGAAVAAIIISIIYSFLLRCLTTCVLYVSLAIIEIIFIGVGILLIMEAAGVQFVHTLPINLAKLSQIQLYIAGSVLIFIGLLFLIVIICLCSQLHLGAKIVQTAAIFLSERFYMALMPIISTIFFFATIAALMAGGIYIYGTGEKTLSARNAFYSINFTTQLIVLFVVFGVAGFWMVCWVFYSNTFIVMSSASIWYYQQDSPFCTSFYRLIRYHTGSIALTSLLFGLLFIIRIIAKFFHLRNQNSQNKIVNVCISISTCCLCVFDQLLKFLSEGVFVQIAMRSTNYCISTLQAFKLLMQNPLKISITGAISYMVAILGMLFCIAIICTGAYFIQIYVPYFSERLTDPLPMTVISGFIVAVVSGVYLSILADSAESIIQCYLIQQSDARKKGSRAKFAPQHLKMILQDHISG